MNIITTILKDKTTKKQWLSLSALFIGFFLLLLSIQLYTNVSEILNGKQQKEDQYDYLVINKVITNSMMGDNSKSYFTEGEINDFKSIHSIQEFAPIVSNQFPIAASTTGDLGFYTQLFFESVPENYLDVTPSTWQWTEGNITVPIILSSDFLNLYNFGFALSQGLPQLSEESIQALSFELTIGQAPNTEVYRAEIAGFSQRYSSVLVPLSFMKYANQKFGDNKPQHTSRIILQTKEADDPALAQYLKNKNYSTQNEKLKMSKIKSVVQLVFGALGLLGLFVTSLAFFLMSLYLELKITRSSHKLQLLSLLGYKPSILHHHFTHSILKSIALLILCSLVVLSIIQVCIHFLLLKINIESSLFIHWITFAFALILFFVIYSIFKNTVKKLIQVYY
jgi:hypothetical protein